jgi:membrane-bound lytic murein transglycosylase A
MPISRTNAPSASNKIRPMQCVAGRGRVALYRGMCAAILGALASCATVTYPPPSPSQSPAAQAAPSAVMTRDRSRWVGANWADLPGWENDAQTELWPALMRSCEKPELEWARVCAEARRFTPTSDAAVRSWLQQRLDPWRVESLDGKPDGLVTGYFEPLVEASRTPRGAFKVPLHAAPADLASRSPYWTRQQLATLPAAQASLRGRDIFYVADPLDALLLQIQGSGRLDVIDANGTRSRVRLAYGGHNNQPYKSVGRWLIDQGELRADQASWPGIKAWAQRNPKRLNEMLWQNPRTVFFREEPLPDPSVGPRGAQGVPLTPGRSIAVDPLSLPYGAPVWLDTTEPLSNAPLRRLVVTQDTGSAIVGAVRADYFWGWGDTAEQQAGRMKQPLRLWVLWPKG